MTSKKVKNPINGQNIEFCPSVQKAVFMVFLRSVDKHKKKKGQKCRKILFACHVYIFKTEDKDEELHFFYQKGHQKGLSFSDTYLAVLLPAVAVVVAAKWNGPEEFPAPVPSTICDNHVKPE